LKRRTNRARLAYALICEELTCLIEERRKLEWQIWQLDRRIFEALGGKLVVPARLREFL